MAEFTQINSNEPNYPLDPKPMSVDTSAGFVTPYKVGTGVLRGTQKIVGTDNSSLTLGNVGSTSQFGVAQYDKTTKLISQYGQQSDGATSLKFFDSNGIGIAQFGKFKDGTFALKVAKPSIEVSTATNDQLIFNSSQDIFKIIDTNTATVAACVGAGTSQHTTVSYSDLGFVPIVIATQAGSSAQTLPIIVPNVATGAMQVLIDVEFVTSTSFQLWSYNMSAGTLPAQTIKWYLLQESAT